MKALLARMLIKLFHNMLYDVHGQPRRLGVTEFVDHSHCPEVIRRGTHWPLHRGASCQGCGVVAPG